MFQKIKKAGISLGVTAKDTVLSKAVQIAISTKIREFGKMLKFNLDSKTKCIDLEVMLEGEQEPLHVKIGKYQLMEAEGKYMLKVYDISTSREWINVIAGKYLDGRTFEIPEEYAKLLKVIV